MYSPAERGTLCLGTVRKCARAAVYYRQGAYDGKTLVLPLTAERTGLAAGPVYFRPLKVLRSYVGRLAGPVYFRPLKVLRSYVGRLAGPVYFRPQNRLTAKGMPRRYLPSRLYFFFKPPRGGGGFKNL